MKCSPFSKCTRLIGTRAYQPGDPWRRVHWQATARMGSLQIKLCEPAAGHGLALFLDMRTTPDHPDEGQGDRLEAAISLAASIFAAELAVRRPVALFANGHLVPNTELGHIDIRGKEAEHRASNRVRLEKELAWKDWAKRFDEYLVYIEKLFWPDLIIVGGGLSKSFAKFAPYLSVQSPVVPAQMLNEAGIIGAAMAFKHHEV